MRSGNLKININFENDMTILLVAAMLLTRQALFGALVILLAIYTSRKITRLIPLLFVSSLYSNYFLLVGNVSLGRIIAIIFVTRCLVELLFRSNKLFIQYSYPLIVVMAISVISLCFSDYHALISITTMLNWLLFITSGYISLGQDERELVLKETFKFSLIVLLCINISGIISPNYVDGRLSVGISSNANNFAMMVVQVSTLIVAYLYMIRIHNKSKLPTLILIMLVVADSFYLIFKSGSRTSLIAWTLTITILFLHKKVHVKKNWVLKKYVCLILLLVGTLVSIGFLTTKNSEIGKRFTLESIKETGGSGRIGIIKTTFSEILPRYLFLGVGPSTSAEIAAVKSYYSDGNSNHNLLISMVTQVGILGTIAYMFFFFRIILDSMRASRNNDLIFVLMAIVIAAFINGIGEVIFDERFFWTALSMLAIFLKKDRLTRCRFVKN